MLLPRLRYIAVHLREYDKAHLFTNVALMWTRKCSQVLLFVVLFLRGFDFVLVKAHRAIHKYIITIYYDNQDKFFSILTTVSAEDRVRLYMQHI